MALSDDEVCEFTDILKENCEHCNPENANVRGACTECGEEYFKGEPITRTSTGFKHRIC